jgi:hypothetical protein
MNELEELVVKEADRLGHQLGCDAVRQAAIDLAGASLTECGLIVLPGLGSISPADFVRSLRARIPDAFKAAEERPSGNLTERMRAEVAAGRRSLPADWNDVYKRATGLIIAEAEEYCRKVDGARLADHDREAERLAEVARQARERLEVEGVRAREECQQQSAHRRLEQLRQREIQKAQEEDLLSTLQTVES